MSKKRMVALFHITTTKPPVTEVVSNGPAVWIHLPGEGRYVRVAAESQQRAERLAAELTMQLAPKLQALAKKAESWCLERWSEPLRPRRKRAASGT